MANNIQHRTTHKTTAANLIPRPVIELLGTEDILFPTAPCTSVLVAATHRAGADVLMAVV